YNTGEADWRTLTSGGARWCAEVEGALVECHGASFATQPSQKLRMGPQDEEELCVELKVYLILTSVRRTRLEGRTTAVRRQLRACSRPISSGRRPSRAATAPGASEMADAAGGSRV